MRKSTFGMGFVILISFINFSYLVNATTGLADGNNSVAPANNVLLNFSWDNSTFIGFSGPDYNSTANITFNLPSGVYYIDGSGSTNMTEGLNNISLSNPTTVVFGNATTNDTVDTVGWFAFNISVSASGEYTLTVNETYDINGTYNVASSTIMLNINNASSSITLYLNGSNNNLTVRSWEAVNITALTNATGSGLVKLSMNASEYGTNFTNGTLNVTNITSSLPTGIYRINASYDGNNNYSSSSLETLYLFVTDLNFSGNSATPSSGINYYSSATYNFSINLTGNISSIVFESNFLGAHNYTTNNSTTYNNITINNSSNTYWITFPALAANIGGYSYRWIANDTNNVWFNTSQTTYVINPVTITPSFTEGGSNSPWTEPSSTSVTLSCSSSYPVSLVISPCGSQTGSGQSVSCAVSTGTGTSYTTYTCSVSSVYNYTGSTTGVLNWGPSTLPPTGIPTTGSGNFSVTPSSNNITIEPGSSKLITLALKNTFSNDMINISISISGLNLTWYSLDKTSIARLRRDGGNDTVKLTLNISQGAERKTYSINVTASGKDGFTLNSISRQTAITLIVPEQEAPQNATESVITNASTTNVTGNETIGPTGLIIKPEDVRNIALFLGIIAIGLVFTFRSNITSLFMKGYKPRHLESKKPSAFSSIKNKIAKMKNYRFSIQLKRRRKLK
jgi:hypothetical protein